MLDFKAKMHKMRFLLDPRPKPRRESLQRSPRLLAVFKGREGKESGGKGELRTGKEKGRGQEMEGGIWSTHVFWRGAPHWSKCLDHRILQILEFANFFTLTHKTMLNESESVILLTAIHQSNNKRILYVHTYQ